MVRYPSLSPPYLFSSFVSINPERPPSEFAWLSRLEEEEGKNSAPKSHGQKIKTWEVMAMNANRKHAKPAIHLSLLILFLGGLSFSSLDSVLGGGVCLSLARGREKKEDAPVPQVGDD